MQIESHMVLCEVGDAADGVNPEMVLRANNGGPNIHVQLSQGEAVMVARRIFGKVKVIFEFEDL